MMDHDLSALQTRSLWQAGSGPILIASLLLLLTFQQFSESSN
jgi:hypothetical protein